MKPTSPSTTVLSRRESSEGIAADAAKAASTADTIDDALASLRTVTFTLDNERRW